MSPDWVIATFQVPVFFVDCILNFWRCANFQVERHERKTHDNLKDRRKKMTTGIPALENQAEDASAEEGGRKDVEPLTSNVKPNRSRLFAFLIPAFIVTLLAYIPAVLLLAYRTSAGKAFIEQRAWQIGLGYGALVVVFGVWIWFLGTTAQKRDAVIFFVVISLLLVAIGMVLLFPLNKQVLVFRAVFLAVVCLLPALIYYLFITTRKVGIFNDYFINLWRLGLLKPHPVAPGGTPADAESECRLRRLNYVHKFESLYGPVPTNLEQALMGNGNPLAVLVKPDFRRSAALGIAEIFTVHTAIPVILATVLIFLGWLIALPPIGFNVPQSEFWKIAFDVNQSPITYAFLGAYFYCLQMLFRRFLLEDLRKSAYVAVSLRIILAVIGTWAAITAISAIKVVDPNYLVVVGFVIGVFPLIVWQFIQGAFKSLLGTLRLSIVLPSLESALPVSDLDGLTTWHQARLQEEDIENVPNMASADIVDLMIGTRFSPERIISWVDQAILYTHLGPEGKSSPSQRDQLRRQGIQTATALIEAFEKAQAPGRSDNKTVEEILSTASGSHVRCLIDAIKTEPNLDLIWKWRGITRDESTDRNAIETNEKAA
jgi:hypothetical protein